MDNRDKYKQGLEWLKTNLSYRSLIKCIQIIDSKLEVMNKLAELLGGKIISKGRKIALEVSPNCYVDEISIRYISSQAGEGKWEPKKTNSSAGA